MGTAPTGRRTAACSGRCTINIRLSAEHFIYVVEHAGDEIVFIDQRHLPMVMECLDRLSEVRHWVVFRDERNPAP